eukprot:m.116894 g.116894  ORF g.116894 m.116894 type:complete len:222 (+) comp12864_c2_seq1:163-828(+)
MSHLLHDLQESSWQIPPPTPTISNSNSGNAFNPTMAPMTPISEAISQSTQDLASLDFAPWPQQPEEVLKGIKPVDMFAFLHGNNSSLKPAPQGKSKTSKSKAGKTKASKTINDEVEDKEEVKKHMNKLAADRYRRKKREQFDELQSRAQQLNDNNRLLKNKCHVLESQVSYLKQLLMATVSNKCPTNCQDFNGNSGNNSNNSNMRGRQYSISGHCPHPLHL